MADVTASGKHKLARAPGARSPTLRRRLTFHFVDRVPARAEPYRIHDTQVSPLFLRVQPTSIKSYNVQWSRPSSKSIGKHPVMTPEAARTQALAILADAAKHGTPEVAKARPKVSTLRDFVDKAFAPWAASHQKWGARAAQRIKVVFVDRLDKPLGDLNPWIIEKWRSRRLKDARRMPPSTATWRR